MGRSAFLPDASVLSGLLARVGAPPPDKPWNGSRSLMASAPPAAELHGERAPQPIGESKALEPASLSLEGLFSELAPLPTLDARFEALAAWLKRETNARAVFVADADGLSMVQAEAGDGYLVLAGEISLVLEQLKALLPEVDQGSTLLRLQKEGSVELVWCKTELGRFTVGLVVEEPLEQKFVSTIKAALAMVTADRMGR